MSEVRLCLLCNRRSDDVVVRLTWWAEPQSGETVSSFERCRDAIGCRDRVLALGDEWLVADGQLRHDPKPPPEPEPRAPVQDPEPAVPASIGGWFDE